MFRYSEVAPPDSARVVASEALIRLACEDLAIPRPEIRWIAPDPYGSSVRTTAINGRARPGVIWLRSDIPLRQLCATVLHEVRHVKQFADHPADATTTHPEFVYRAIEDTAFAYESRFPSAVEMLCQTTGEWK